MPEIEERFIIRFFSLANAIIPQADHDFKPFCLGGRQYGTRHTTGRTLERCVDLRIRSDNGELLGVWIELFQGRAWWVRRYLTENVKIIFVVLLSFTRPILMKD